MRAGRCNWDGWAVSGWAETFFVAELESLFQPSSRYPNFCILDRPALLQRRLNTEKNKPLKRIQQQKKMQVKTTHSTLSIYSGWHQFNSQGLTFSDAKIVNLMYKCNDHCTGLLLNSHQHKLAIFQSTLKDSILKKIYAHQYNFQA